MPYLVYAESEEIYLPSNHEEPGTDKINLRELKFINLNITKTDKMKRKATAVWHGTLKEGKGHLSTQSGVLKETPYNFKMRFEDEKGTNPEELIGAAHSGCFSMQLSAFLAEEGHKPVELETKAEVTLDNGTITSSHLILNAKVPGIDREKFDRLAQKAKENCPVSKLLKADISMDVTLNG